MYVFGMSFQFKTSFSLKEKLGFANMHQNGIMPFGLTPPKKRCLNVISNTVINENPKQHIGKKSSN